MSRIASSNSSRAGLWTILSVFMMGQVAGQPSRSPFIGFQSVPSHLYQHWKAHGNRTEKPGAERIIGAGTIVRRSTPASAPSAPAGVSILLEFPGRVRIDEAGKGVMTQDVDGPANSSRSEDAEDLLELLLEDFTDGFFRALTSGASAQWIGENFRTTDAVVKYLDIMEIRYKTKVRGNAATQVKRYYLDSRTKLLSKVVYRQAKSRGVVTVEAEFGDWVSVNGQSVPRSWVRREDGVEMLRINLSQASVAAAANDGAFGVTGQ